jgi:hypothetical protein
LGASVGLTSPDDVLTGSVRLDGVYDLAQTPPDRAAVTPVDESEVDLEASVGYGAYVALDLAVGYDFNATGFDDFDDPYADYDYENGAGDFEEGVITEPGDETGGKPLYKPLEVGVTAGTLSQDDAFPGFRASVSRDLNDGEMESLGLEANARLGPLELAATQTFDFENASADDSSLTLSYPDIIELRATGFSLLPPSWVGLTPDQQEPVSYEVSLADLTQQDTTKLYELTYATSYGPLLFNESVVSFYGTSLSATVNLETDFVATPLGPLGFGVEFSGDLSIA